MQARCFAERWPLRTAFAISRDVRTEAQLVVVEVRGEGVVGIGECTPYARYGESVASVMQQLRPLFAEVAAGLDRTLLQSRLPAGAARNALDCALADWEFKCRGAVFTGPESLPSMQTLVIDDPAAMAVAARNAIAQGADTLKLKLDDQQVYQRVAAVRAAVPAAQLVIDANEAWRADTLVDRCSQLEELGVAMLEQPLPAGDDEFLGTFPHPLPICADESCHSREDLPHLLGRYEILNIKLDKTGGITEARALAEEAEAQGFQLMLGCMLCTSRAIRAAWPLGERACFLDLDGPTWLAKDVEFPLRFGAGRVYWS
ncbi:L-Ala-D/L-Glu epimerase [Microbulbifer spongiae]|uniref:L-Ala-D/L-Glu epimerase n=1 Tax=Microbulbifer spongiae TaxID=2944933 RepID=A0ABY9EFF0_9GAMM|nr:L-Ala-D/L-Glu epimerase [Microbulbifer sp. MI-G]WKD50902.1 L-Ala-D/L-Glu epimerase [Microbulbifer sp. MI-G]